MRKPLRQAWTVTLGALALTETACQPRHPAERINPGSLVPGSAYNARLVLWLRDSIVLDSMTRLVNTDSLYRLYRRALEPGGVNNALMTAVACEQVRLKIGFGSVPAGRAIEVLQDTMYLDRGIHDGGGYFVAHAPAEGTIELSPARCGPYRVAAPKTIGTTRLDTELPPRPRAPRLPNSSRLTMK